MKIAACDDNQEFLQELSGLLNQYCEEYGENLQYKLFANPLELIAQIEKGIHFDAVLLDVCMPGINGIQCARDIRAYDSCVKIIFLTLSAEYAVESYAVKAYQYLLKPIQKEKLFATLKQMEREINNSRRDIFILKSKTEVVKIMLHKLEYCEMLNRKIIFHFTDGEEVKCSMKMNELEQAVEKFGMFIRPHRSFLVNMEYIQSLTSVEVIMESGVRIPIPREKHNQVKKIYLDYIFRQANSVILGGQER